ncbi:Winged helix DNA-binding domain-containing protein [Modestobacter sp. DSM 44400]|uniref:winged helix DNA-binding domain-containing protein n=1 Tax=Modestobacter sp. DSM 44400 TaxID=1550230 RepID=UPI00089760DA|nr:winged helix DNA-binding domain-containing protein [Modestobacter sp. DSM 44400]SDY52414.1 Winged helix DNA-binding domain-containing protein [Modestobacter sp. DSM 44400]
MTSRAEVALLRLVAQRLAGPRPATAGEAVRWLTAVQGQDLPGALTSVALRTVDGTRAGVTAALDRGKVVRSWPMRGTLHLVPAEDLGWMLAVLGPRVLAGAAGRRAALGLTDDDVEHALEVAVAALAGSRRLTRADLLAALAGAGIDTTGQRGYHLLWYLAQTGTLCLGPTAGAEQLFVLLDEWVPAPRRLDREEALGELALRFYRSHGPATVKDLVRWAGVLVRDVRAGLAVAAPRLERLDVDGTEHWMDPATPDRLAECRAEAREVLLLPGFDELVLGYADRSCTVPPAFADRIVPGNNGMFRATVVSEGRVVAVWRRAGRPVAPTIAVEPFTGLAPDVAAAVRQRFAVLP